MRYFYFAMCICAASFVIIACSVLYETGGVLEREALSSVYKEETSLLFLFHRDSSFYSVYALIEGSADLQLRKAGHFFAYGLIAASIYTFTILASVFHRAFIATSSASLIGAIDEIHQHFLLNRSGRLLDIFINMAGSITAVTIITTIIFATRPIKRAMLLVHKHLQL